MTFPGRPPFDPAGLTAILERIGCPTADAESLRTFAQLEAQYGWDSQACRRFGRMWRADERAGVPEGQRGGFRIFLLAGVNLVFRDDVERWTGLLAEHALTTPVLNAVRRRAGGGAQPEVLMQDYNLTREAVSVAARDIYEEKKK